MTVPVDAYGTPTKTTWTTRCPSQKDTTANPPQSEFHSSPTSSGYPASTTARSPITTASPHDTPTPPSQPSHFPISPQAYLDPLPAQPAKKNNSPRKATTSPANSPPHSSPTTSHYVKRRITPRRQPTLTTIMPPDAPRTETRRDETRREQISTRHDGIRPPRLPHQNSSAGSAYMWAIMEKSHSAFCILHTIVEFGGLAMWQFLKSSKRGGGDTDVSYRDGARATLCKEYLSRLVLCKKGSPMLGPMLCSAGLAGLGLDNWC